VPAKGAIDDFVIADADIILRDVAPVRVAELTAVAASFGRADIAATVRRLRPRLLRALAEAGARPADDRVIVYYEDFTTVSDAVIVHAAVPVDGMRAFDPGLALVQLPAMQPAATLLHRGAATEITQSLWRLASWLEDHGYRAVGYHREVRRAWVPATALQVAVVDVRQR
jgi:effector-binding domain-containing protein